MRNMLLDPRISLAASSSHSHTINRNRSKPEHNSTSPKHSPLGLSVLDLIADDGQDDKSERVSAHEAHVAFSLAGLGKVGDETPAHSPQHLTSWHSPSKAERQFRSSRNMNHVLNKSEFNVDALVQDFNMPLDGNVWELPFYSGGVLNSFCNMKQKLSTSKMHRQLDETSSKIRSPFSDEDICYDIKENLEASGFSDLFEEKEYDVSWETPSCQLHNDSVDFFKLKDHETLDFFEDRCTRRKRLTGSLAERFSILESTDPYMKHKKEAQDCDFRHLDRERYPTVGWKCHSRAPTNEPAWSAFVKDHEKDSSILLSEESCSSSAVNDLSSREGTKGHGSELKRSDTLYREIQSVYPTENRERSSTMFMRTSNLSKLTPTKFSELTCLGQMKPLDNWSCETEFSKVDKDLDFDYFCQITDMGYAEAGGRTETEDLFAQFPNPKLRDKTESSSLRSKVGNCSFNGCFSKKHAFGQPFGIGKSCSSPVFSKKGFEKDYLDSFPGPEMDVLHPDFSCPDNSHGTWEFPHAAQQTLVNKGEESESQTQPANCCQFGIPKETCTQSDSLSSENGKPIGSSDSKGSHACDLGKDETQEQLDFQKTSYSSEHVEEISPGKIHAIVGSSIDEKEVDHGAQTSPPCQDSNKEVGEMKAEERIVSKWEKCYVQPSSQVMMLESYVLQLLCMQKVVKGVPGQDSLKKVAYDLVPSGNSTSMLFARQ